MKDLRLIMLPSSGSPVSADYNDFDYDDNGDFVYVEGPARKLQDVIKILITQIGSNPVFPAYGSTLPNIPGTRNVNNQAAELVREGVIQAMAFLAEIETSPNPDERLKGIKQLKAQVDTSDARRVHISLLVELEDGTLLDTTDFILPVGGR